MPTHWVYAGFSGTLESCYGAPFKYAKCRAGECQASDPICTCCGTHPQVYGTHPVDISAAGGTQVALITSNSIKSFTTTQINGTVCDDACGDGIDDALRVDLYTDLNGGGSLAGTVWFCHAYDRLVNANRNLGFYDAAKSVWYNICKIPPGTCGDCYTGSHVHHETSGSCYFSFGCSGSCPSYTGGASPLFCFTT